MLVFSLNEPFNESVQTAYLKEIQQLKPENTDVILVGNKADLEPKCNREEVLAFCEQHNLSYAEVSAKTGKNLKELFLKICGEM